MAFSLLLLSFSPPQEEAYNSNKVSHFHSMIILRKDGTREKAGDNERITKRSAGRDENGDT